MKFNDAGLKLIKEFEGCSLVAYQDQKGVWSIGYGCTHNVGPGITITAEQAQTRLDQDLSQVCDRVEAILQNNKVSLNGNQFSACVCLAYNIGCGAFASSTLLRRLKNWEIEEAAEQFLVWDKVSGVSSDGLLRRRKAEKALFSTPEDKAPI